MNTASEPMSWRRRFLRMAERMSDAARSGVVAKNFSNSAADFPSTHPCRWVIRALRAMLVLMPPGWTQVTPMGLSSTSSSWRSASVKPFTANFAAL